MIIRKETAEKRGTEMGENSEKMQRMHGLTMSIAKQRSLKTNDPMHHDPGLFISLYKAVARCYANVPYDSFKCDDLDA